MRGAQAVCRSCRDNKVSSGPGGEVEVGGPASTVERLTPGGPPSSPCLVERTLSHYLATSGLLLDSSGSLVIEPTRQLLIVRQANTLVPLSPDTAILTSLDQSVDHLLILLQPIPALVYSRETRGCRDICSRSCPR